MNKSIELMQSQIKALENGATMLIFHVELSDYQNIMGNTEDDIENIYINNGVLHIYFKDDYRQISKIPLQKGDKDVFVKEEFEKTGDLLIPIVYRADGFSVSCFPNWQPASQMTKEQSRFSLDCIDVRVLRVQDINFKEKEELTLCNDYSKIIDIDEHYEGVKWLFEEKYNKQLKEQNINKTYEDNDYIFLCEVKVK